MIILALDPGSITTGYAVLSADKLYDAGILRAPKAKPPITRIGLMLDDLDDVWAENGGAIKAVVIEVPEGKRHARMGKINMAGLAILGMAAGAIWAYCCRFGVGVYTVGVNEWSVGAYSTKQRRQQVVTSLFGQQYQAATDKNFDMSDAIALGLWWLSERDISVDNPLT